MDPYALLDVFDEYVAQGKLAEAEAMKAELLARWPTDQSVLVSVAELLERQGRYEEALALMRSGHVNLSPSSNAYPHYLRMLTGAQHWEEAVLEARWAFQMPTVWTPQARLARIFALLHFGEREMLRQTLAEFDPAEYPDLIEDWVSRFRGSGALPALRALLAKDTENARLAVLRDRFA